MINVVDTLQEVCQLRKTGRLIEAIEKLLHVPEGKVATLVRRQIKVDLLKLGADQVCPQVSNVEGPEAGPASLVVEFLQLTPPVKLSAHDTTTNTTKQLHRDVKRWLLTNPTVWENSNALEWAATVSMEGQTAVEAVRALAGIEVQVSNVVAALATIRAVWDTQLDLSDIGKLGAMAVLRGAAADVKASLENAGGQPLAPTNDVNALRWLLRWWEQVEDRPSSVEGQPPVSMTPLRRAVGLPTEEIQEYHEFPTWVQAWKRLGRYVDWLCRLHQFGPLGERCPLELLPEVEGAPFNLSNLLGSLAKEVVPCAAAWRWVHNTSRRASSPTRDVFPLGTVTGLHLHLCRATQILRWVATAETQELYGLVGPFLCACHALLSGHTADWTQYTTKCKEIGTIASTHGLSGAAWEDWLATYLERHLNEWALVEVGLSSPNIPLTLSFGATRALTRLRSLQLCDTTTPFISSSPLLLFPQQQPQQCHELLVILAGEALSLDVEDSEFRVWLLQLGGPGMALPSRAREVQRWFQELRGGGTKGVPVHITHAYHSYMGVLPLPLSPDTLVSINIYTMYRMYKHHLQGGGTTAQKWQLSRLRKQAAIMGHTQHDSTTAVTTAPSEHYCVELDAKAEVAWEQHITRNSARHALLQNAPRLLGVPLPVGLRVDGPGCVRNWSHPDEVLAYADVSAWVLSLPEDSIGRLVLEASVAYHGYSRLVEETGDTVAQSSLDLLKVVMNEVAAPIQSLAMARTQPSPVMLAVVSTPHLQLAALRARVASLLSRDTTLSKALVDRTLLPVWQAASATMPLDVFLARYRTETHWREKLPALSGHGEWPPQERRLRLF